jgi:hypothetical protein
MLSSRLSSLARIIAYVCDKKLVFALVLAFDYLFVVIHLIKPGFLMGSLFLVINLFFLVFSKSKNGLGLIFWIYPLARVLKFPGIGTSFLTILLPLFYLVLLFRVFFRKKKVINSTHILVFALYAIYVLLTFSVSLINWKGFSFLELLSYYSYLAFPVVCFFTLRSDDEIDGTGCLLLALSSSLFGMIVTIGFFYAYPNGGALLVASGINVFDEGLGGVRFSPLTDDPNYGSALVALLSTLFLSSKKNHFQKVAGYPILVITLLISLASLSKMFMLCVMVIALTLIVKLILKYHSVVLTSCLLFAGVTALLVFINSSLGISLLVRLIGTDGNISINRMTSGRAEIFGEYSSFILSNPLSLLFGMGPLYADLTVFSAGEHNLFTKNIFGSGVLGVGIMLLVFFLMLKNRLDKRREYPTELFFSSFLICLIICSMSLGLAPSTVFPIVVVGAQFAVFGENIPEDTEGLSKRKRGVAREEPTIITL